jgi:hypothetical protein
MQDLEVHAIPIPGLASQAALVRHTAGAQHMCLGQRRGHRTHRPLRQQRRGAAHVVDVAVAQHQQVDLGLPTRAQQRQQHALGGIDLL